MTPTQNDRLILEQYKVKVQARELRTHKHIEPLHGAGNSSIGSIFDCSRKQFERMLKAYSSSLYVGWNPQKRDGNGVWEVWHRPSSKTPILQGIMDNGDQLWTLEYRPNDFEHHVYDLPYLTYDFIRKLKEMDMWANKNFIAQMDTNLEEMEQKAEKEEQDLIRYAVRHNKKLFGQLKGLAQDGYNPFWFFSDKRQGNGKV